METRIYRLPVQKLRIPNQITFFEIYEEKMAVVKVKLKSLKGEKVVLLKTKETNHSCVPGPL